MQLKPGVNPVGIRPELLLALMVAESVWRELDLPDLVVTSLLDGKHSTTSLHYAGCAADLRTFNVPSNLIPTIVARLRERLGKHYDVIPEQTHIHIEFQPRHPV